MEVAEPVLNEIMKLRKGKVFKIVNKFREVDLLYMKYENV